MSSPIQIENYTCITHPDNTIFIFKPSSKLRQKIQKLGAPIILILALLFAAIIILEIIGKQISPWKLLIYSSALLLAALTYSFDRKSKPIYQGFTFHPEKSLTTPNGDIQQITSLTIKTIKQNFAIIAVADNYHHTIATLRSKSDAEQLHSLINSCQRGEAGLA